MSPLACSMLALAAMFAVATAFSEPDPYCGELNQGTRTVTTRYFELKGRGGLHTIPDRCAPDGAVGMERVGQSIVVCNEPNSKPEIIPVAGDKYNQVMVECPNNTYGCEKLKIKVTQYCDVVYPQKPKVKAG